MKHMNTIAAVFLVHAYVQSGEIHQPVGYCIEASTPNDLPHSGNQAYRRVRLSGSCHSGFVAGCPAPALTRNSMHALTQVGRPSGEA